MPKFNLIRKALGLPEMTEEREKQIEEYKQNPEKMIKDAITADLDRIKDKEDISLFFISPAEEAMAQEMTSLFGVGSLGRARGIASAYKNKEVFEKNMKNLEEFKPDIKTFSLEKWQKLNDLYNQILKSGKYTRDQIRDAYIKLKNYEKEAIRRGIKIPTED